MPFNHTLREDVRDAYLFSSLEEVCKILDDSLEEYDLIRPYEALQGLPPYHYAAQNAGLRSVSTLNWY